MQVRTRLASLLAGMLLSTALFAQTSETNEKLTNYSPYFAKVGKTIFVSGPMARWLGQLTEALPPPKSEAHMKAYIADESKWVDLVVFVNATSPHPESTRGSDYLIERLLGNKISTKIVGECDMFCARLFIAGKSREFGQDLNGEPARLKFQVPVDFETKKIERKFPNTQIAVYERLLPDFAMKYRELLVRGFTQPVDTTGGLFIGPNDVKYCSTLTSINCEAYAGLDALKIGLTTSQNRVPEILPDRFPAPLPSGYAAINDISDVIQRSEAIAADYERFLKAPNSENRAFAVPDDKRQAVSAAAWGTKDGEDAAVRALRRCEEVSKSRCRLYATGNDVVW